ncbi:MAG: glutamine-synthetase adenylyltransferase, partial [Henriciella sp.]
IATVRPCIERLAETGRLSGEEADKLINAFQFLQSLQQIQRLAVGADMTSESFSRGLKKRLAMAAGCENFHQLEARYTSVKNTLSELRCKKIGPLATET